MIGIWKGVIFISLRLLRFAYKSYMFRIGEISKVPSSLEARTERIKERRTKCAGDFIEKHSADIEYPFSTLVYFAHVDGSIFIHARVRNIFCRLFSAIPSLGYSTKWKALVYREFFNENRRASERRSRDTRIMRKIAMTPEMGLAEVTGVSPREIISGDRDF